MKGFHCGEYVIFMCMYVHTVLVKSTPNPLIDNLAITHPRPI